MHSGVRVDEVMLSTGGQRPLDRRGGLCMNFELKLNFVALLWAYTGQICCFPRCASNAQVPSMPLRCPLWLVPCCAAVHSCVHDVDNQAARTPQGCAAPQLSREALLSAEADAMAPCCCALFASRPPACCD
eukprot:TRINITY_DN14128_c0_g1_i1.p1 TRINITY_DN14128_c0_g1~~TRINITY_DN14128_c0_g1_i1.p1  ORF type:complete len:131 (+),score=13.35 TRINITY_DN14128_c0_g1_i1:228-620(+)